jgi:hypothetical protein
MPVVTLGRWHSARRWSMTWRPRTR